MSNLLALLQRYYVLLMFLILQVFALVTLFSENNFHRKEFIRHSSDFAGWIYEKRDNFTSYLRLSEINDQLALENAMLRSLLPENYLQLDSTSLQELNVKGQVLFKYTPAKVVNVTVSRKRNYITVNRGMAAGIEPEMGVIANGAIVGIVSSVSKHYSVIMPVLNTKFQGSVKMKNSGEFGILEWLGGDPEYAYVKEMPKHVYIQVGDSVVTTGYSSHFPEGIMVGKVETLEDKPEENFHRVKVKLETDYRKLGWVQLVKNIYKVEQDSIMQQQIQMDGGEE
ncbi:MAG: rod shape-determining protein MreC [Bacteroidetes bacterium]|nr:rod shape-determining protein MreC [Bacteroidota bacterium]